MARYSQGGGDTPSLDGAPSSSEHENRFSSNKTAPAAENKKEQGGARKTERKKR
jgi:hypothetical protein